jgi:phage gp29-like protein
MIGYLNQDKETRRSILGSRLVRWWPERDLYREYVLHGLSATRLASLQRRIDQGEIHLMVAAQEEMEMRVGRIQGIASTRRRALLGLPWTISPPPGAEDNGAAMEAADYCMRVLRDMPAFEPSLGHLATAIGPNISVVELIWEGFQLRDMVTVPGSRLRAWSMQREGLYIETQDEPLGLLAMPHKFVVHIPACHAVNPFSATLTRATIQTYLLLHHTIANWMIHLEVYGMPIRVARTKSSATDEERAEVEDMLRKMGSDTWAHFSDSVQLEFIGAPSGTPTYEAMARRIDDEIAVLWLGQTLTTDIGDRGSFAAATIHNQIRGDILRSDISDEARTVRSQILAPMVRMRWPNMDVPVPQFRRELPTYTDMEAERLKIERLEFAREAGLRIPEAEMHRMLNLPMEMTDIVSTADKR